MRADGKLKKQMDYILINQRYRNCLRQNSPITKLDCGTNYNIVVDKIKIRLNKIWKIKKDKRLNTNVLMKNEELKQRYEEEINKNTKDTDGNCRSIKDTIRNTAKEVLTTAKMEARKPWMTQEILNIIKERNKLEKVSAVNEYKELSRIIQKKCREAKTKYINEQCRIIEELEERHDHTKMYQTVRRMQRKEILKKSKNILNKDGTILEGNEEQGNRWKEYMNELYEGQKLNSNENILVDETDTITDYEIDIAMNKLRNNKATGTDKIPIELIKYGGETLKKAIRSIIKKAYDSGKIDEDFIRTEFMAIPKKNGTMKFEEHRTISLTSHTSKILYTTVLNKIAPILNSQINKLITIWIYAKPRYTGGHNSTQINNNKQIKSTKGHIYMIYRFRKSL